MTAVGYLSGGGGGGGAVDSVNGETGVVVLDATNTPPASIGAATTGHTHTGTYQPLDTDLTAIAGLSPADDDVIQRVAGSWLNRTMAQLKTSLGLTKNDVGLGNVDNTSDASKPVSTDTQTVLDTKMNRLVVRNLRVEEATNLTFPSTASAWQNLTGLAVSCPAAVGDYCELTWNFMWDTTGNNFLDWHIFESAAIIRAMSSDTAIPKDEGAPWLYPGADAFDKSPGPWGIVVTAPMIVGGLLTCRLAAKAVGSGTIFRSTTYPFTAKLKNFGPADVA